jgi:hypothetical protein
VLLTTAWTGRCTTVSPARWCNVIADLFGNEVPHLFPVQHDFSAPGIRIWPSNQQIDKFAEEV